ncbi:MAG: hypothetical protein D6731_17565 [Planctomycetota bacterium]|nr:MAG: hypothetical protein D6731_17565 [Planctomycetota bacterium]
MVYEPNGTEHDDLVLRLGPFVARSDSYYYALDREEGRAERSAIPSLRALLRQWREAVEAADVGAVIYLPYDFSDQRTGWLRCVLGEGGFEIAPGWSDVEGYAFVPSDFAETAAALADFEPFEGRGVPLTLARDEVLAGIEASECSLSEIEGAEGDG